jgi:malectin (di-glucose binding ER protein)
MGAAMPSIAADSARVEDLRAELQLVLQSQSFARSPGLSRLLSYLCEKTFAAESDKIKEYSIALDVFGRHESFDQDSDSIVRVQANRLRKHLSEYYAGEGHNHRFHIKIPVGQYVPDFEEQAEAPETHLPDLQPPFDTSRTETRDVRNPVSFSRIAVGALLLGLASVFILAVYDRVTSRKAPASVPTAQESAAPMVGLPIGDEIRILAGSSRTYVDRSGKLWYPDEYFTGGTVVHSPVQHIWRTQDPTIYRTSRQGDFHYDIPLKGGIYELHLHFAETLYGPEDIGGGGEGSRIMNITANGKPLLNDFDVLADSAGGRTADVKIFTDVAPAEDGFLHLAVSSANGRGMISAIEILPGYRGRMRPVRMVARDVPYYSNDSHWWSSDGYFRGGQFGASEVPASGTDDPELYETERWGHFSYAIPVAPGRYTLILHFIEHGLRAASEDGAESTREINSVHARVFDVFCNGRPIVSHLNIAEEAGNNRPLVRKITRLEPNPQGKLVLDFVPLNHYATVSAIEVLSE